MPLLLLSSAKNEDVGDGRFIWGDVVGIFKDGGGCFGKPSLAIVTFGGYKTKLLGLLECLCEGRLARPRSATVWADLCPAFPKEIT